MLVSTVGPFAKWGEPAVRAAIAAGGTYIDTTGEPAFIRRVFEEFGAPAARGPARALLTAMGYDFVPGALAGALALEEAGEAAVRVDVGYYALGGGPDVAERGHARVARRRDAGRRLRVPRRRACATARPAERVRSFRVRGQAARGGLGRRRRALRAAGGVSAAARGQRVPRLVRAAGAADAGGDAGRLGRSRACRGDARRDADRGRARWSGSPARPRRARPPAGCRGSPPRRSTRAGCRWPRCTSSGADGYEFTAAFLAWARGGRCSRASRRRAAGPGRGVRARGPAGGMRVRGVGAFGS